MPFRDEEGYEPSLKKDFVYPLLMAALLAVLVFAPIIYVTYFR